MTPGADSTPGAGALVAAAAPDTLQPPATAAGTGRETSSKGEVVVHPWVVPPDFRVADAYFTNLKDGAQVEAPFVLKFGLARRGSVPAGHSAGRSGHHHLLIDQVLPSNLNKPLPFNDHYIHFGKGQLETVVDLPPGEHTVRLLLADKAHVLYFIYSEELKFTVTKQNTGADKNALLGRPRVELLSPANKSMVKMPLRVQFHTSGINVSHAAAKVPDTGHFRLTLDRRGQKPEVIDLEGGQTEAWPDLPKGEYDAQLDLISNTAADKRMAHTEGVSFTVP